MVKRTGPTNDNLVMLIRNLSKQKSGLLKRVALELNKSARNKREVNLSRINRNSKAKETVLIPGKVLGHGDLNHELTIIGLSASSGALLKIKSSKSEFISINDFVKSKKPLKGVKILG